jgi:hypothetical protein
MPVTLKKVFSINIRYIEFLQQKLNQTSDLNNTTLYLQNKQP